MAEFGYLHGNGIELVICKNSEISYPLHSHVSVFTLGFILDGAVELITDKGMDIYGKNDIFMVFPYTPHCLNAVSCYTLLSLCIRTEMVYNPSPEKVKSDTADFLHTVINQPEMEGKMLQALSSLSFTSRMVPAQKETAFSSLKMQLEMYPECKYSIDDMAKSVVTSKYHFIRSFKQESGLTPHQFQIQNRIRKAQRMLKESSTITEVALATGFCDQSHFIRHFEKIVGLTPTDYRAACKVKTPVSIT